MERPFAVRPDDVERLRLELAGLDPTWGRLAPRPLGAGMDAIVFEIPGFDDTGVDHAERSGPPPLVVRCPRHDAAAANAAMQRRALPLVAAHVTLPVPRPVAHGQNPLGPGSFDVLARVPGAVVADSEWHRGGLLTDPAVIAVVAATIDELATIPVADARACGVPDVDLRQTLADLQRRAAPAVSPLLAAHVAARLDARWSRVIADDTLFAGAAVVTHTDISLDHLLVADGAVGGLIDFGDLRIGDPDAELAYLHADAGPAFVAAVQAARGRHLTPALDAKLGFLELADSVTDVLWGLDLGDTDLVTTSLAAITHLVGPDPADHQISPPEA